MKKRAVALSLVISVVTAFAGPAGAYYCPPPRQVYPRPVHNHRYHYYYDDEYYYDHYNSVTFTYGIGMLLGTIAANNDAAEQARQQERERKITSVRDRCREAAATETGHVAELIEGTGLKNTLEFLQNYWNAKTMRTFLEDRNNIAILTITGFEDNVKVEYTFMKEYKEVTVKASSSEYKIAEEKKAYYKEPLPRSELSLILGMDLADALRSASGYLVAQNVVKGTASAFAGIAPGDAVIKIDAYETKSVDAARISAYVSARAQAKALLKVTFMHEGKKKTAEIQL